MDVGHYQQFSSRPERIAKSKWEVPKKPHVMKNSSAFGKITANESPETVVGKQRDEPTTHEYDRRTSV